MLNPACARGLDIYICVCVCVYIYIYIYTFLTITLRRSYFLSNGKSLHIPLLIYIYIYIYIIVLLNIFLLWKKTSCYGYTIFLILLTKSMKKPNVQLVQFSYLFQVAADCGSGCVEVKYFCIDCFLWILIKHLDQCLMSIVGLGSSLNDISPKWNFKN